MWVLYVLFMIEMFGIIVLYSRPEHIYTPEETIGESESIQLLPNIESIRE